LKYILSWILQYVIALIPSNGGLGLITRLLTPKKETGADQDLIKRESKDLEPLIVYTGRKEPTEPSGASFGMPARQTEGMLDFGLRLVDEIVRQNREMMKFEVDEKTPKTVIR
jgi:hypothetical protein